MVVSKLMAGVFENETSLVETGRLLHLLTYHAKKVRYQNLLIRYQAAGPLARRTRATATAMATTAAATTASVWARGRGRTGSW